MCACEPGYTCSKHWHGSWVDADQNLRDWRAWMDEAERDRIERELSAHDFEQPYGRPT